MGQLRPATRRSSCGSDDGAASHLAVGERPCAWCESVLQRRAILAERWIPVPEPPRLDPDELLQQMVAVLDRALRDSRIEHRRAA